MNKIKPLSDLSRLCLHTITNKPWDLKTCLSKYSAAGIGGISVWRNMLEGRPLSESKKMLNDSGLETVSLVRGGFFTGTTLEEKNKSIEENKLIIDEAAAIGAPLIVLVCGATPGQSVKENLKQIAEGIVAIAPYAKERGVKLGIEPLHPMYGDKRSAVVSMKSANDLCDEIGAENVGVTIDVFHLWWEKELEEEIQRCGKNNNIFSFHICDWKIDMLDMLNDRGLMGEGIINVPQIRTWVEKAGFNGFIEVEIFSNLWWEKDQDVFLNEICKTYKTKS